MATVMPGAEYRPLGPQTQGRLSNPDIVCLHTMVGTLMGTDAYFKQNGYGGTESHFGVGADGTIFQWQDLDFSADANLNGNGHIISIETSDMGSPFPKWDTNTGNVPPWTNAQIEACARILAWCHKRYGIKLELLSNSKRGNNGVGYHRLGVPRFKGDTLSQTNGELWSSAPGKVCPGNKRISQIPTIIERAQRLVNPGPAPEEGFLMALSDDEQRELLAKVRDIHWKETVPLDYTKHGATNEQDQYGHNLSMRKELGYARTVLTRLEALIREKLT